MFEQPKELLKLREVILMYLTHSELAEGDSEEEEAEDTKVEMIGVLSEVEEDKILEILFKVVLEIPFRVV